MNIFLAFTPYHSLLAYSAALSQKEKENVLFVVAEFPGAKVLSKALRDSSFKVFTNVICLPGTHKGRNILAKVFTRKKNTFSLKAFIAKYCVENVFVGNNSRIEAQAALYYAKNMYPDCKGIYMEDGTAVYRSEFPEKKKFFIKFFCRVFFGSWWRDEHILGTSPKIDTCQVLFPKFVREELKTKNIIAVNKKNFLQIRKDKSFTEYLYFLNFDTQAIKNIDVLLISLHSDVGKEYPLLKEAMRVILSYIENKKLRVSVKYHPRELLKDFLMQKGKKNVLILPRAIPLELLYAISSNPPKLIIGGHSTALLTARWIFPKAKIISIAPLFGYYDINIFETFKKNNIHFVSNINDINTVLESMC